MGENLGENTLKESLGLLNSTSDDFADFVIDSDDEILEEPSLPSKQKVNSLSQPQSTGIKGGTVGVGATTSNGSTKLKKETVNANDDPLSLLLISPTPAVKSGPSNTISTVSHTTDARAESSSNTSNISNSALNSISSSANAAAVSQSLSSTFSSFATKFQDAVTSATYIGEGSSQGYPRMANSNTGNVSAKYVERSVERNNSGLSSSSALINQSPSYNSLSSNPTVYNSSRIIDSKAQQGYLGNGPISHELDNAMKS